MKLIVSLSCLVFSCAALSSEVLAADLGAPEVAVSEVPSWQGFYLGLSGGLGFSGDRKTDLRSDITGGFGPFKDAYSTVGVLGVAAGYDHSWGPWVVGLMTEASVDIGDGDKRRRAGVVRLDIESRRVAAFTIAPRIGRVFGNSLFYALGGLQVAKLKYDMAASDGVLSARLEDRFWKAGFVVGAGVETLLAPNVSLDIGYRYSRFGAKTISAPVVDGAGAATGENLSTKAKLDQHVARVGVNYRF